MIQGSLSAYETHHGCSFEASSVRAAVHLSHRYMTEEARSLRRLHGDARFGCVSQRTDPGQAGGDTAAVAEVVAESARMPVEQIDGGDEATLNGGPPG